MVYGKSYTIYFESIYFESQHCLLPNQSPPAVLLRRALSSFFFFLFSPPPLLILLFLFLCSCHFLCLSFYFQLLKSYSFFFTLFINPSPALVHSKFPQCFVSLVAFVKISPFCCIRYFQFSLQTKLKSPQEQGPSHNHLVFPHHSQHTAYLPAGSQ